MLDVLLSLCIVVSVCSVSLCSSTLSLNHDSSKGDQLIQLHLISSSSTASMDGFTETWSCFCGCSVTTFSPHMSTITVHSGLWTFWTKKKLNPHTGTLPTMIKSYDWLLIVLVGRGAHGKCSRGRIVIIWYFCIGEGCISEGESTMVTQSLVVL